MGELATTWEGHELRVRCNLVARYGWLATEETLLVDGVPVASHGGFNLRARSWVALEHGGGHVKVELRSAVSWKSARCIHASVLVDDVVVMDGAVPIGIAWRG